MSSRGPRPERGQPPGGQPLVRRHGRGDPHVHGDPGHHDRHGLDAVHRRRPVGDDERQRLGHDQLPGGQRHHPADHGLALGPPGPPQVLPPLHRRLHRRLGAVRPGHQPRATDPLPGDPGHGRRRAPARQPGDPDRRLPAREAGHGHDGVRRGGADRPGHRPDAGRLHHGQLQLALDLPHQPPDRRPRLPDVPLRGPRTPNTSRRSGRS